MLSWEKMVTDTVKWCDTLQENDYDVVVGVPRVGMFVATIISCRLNIPLATPDSMMQGDTYFPPHMQKPPISNILVVDDAVKRGMALWRVKDEIQHAYPYSFVTSGALYKVTDFAQCDIFFERTFGYTSQESDLRQEIQTP
jgi:hypoxanthine phosphoribosyltransferase